MFIGWGGRKPFPAMNIETASREELAAEVKRLGREDWTWSNACETAAKQLQQVRADCAEACRMLEDATQVEGIGPDAALKWFARRSELSAQYADRPRQ